VVGDSQTRTLIVILAPIVDHYHKYSYLEKSSHIYSNRDFEAVDVKLMNTVTLALVRLEIAIPKDMRTCFIELFSVQVVL
jgi:hypothetical protein